jgi:trehalose 6-phosphate phosphatase
VSRSVRGTPGVDAAGRGAGRPVPPVDPWPVVRDRVVRLAAAPGPLLVVTDFDGTLARISVDPMAARIEPLGRSALRRLARLAAEHPTRLRVVVLSGRTAQDVAGRVRVGGIGYLGDHGLQGGVLARRAPPERLAVSAEPGLAELADPARALGRAVAAALGDPDWLFVEEKGPSVALHYRAAPDPDAAGRLVEAAVEDRLRSQGDGRLERFDGRRILELRPVGAGGKGAAVARLLAAEPFRTAIVLGDDRSDAEAFAAIATARTEGRLEAGLALAVHGSTETPPEVVARADLILAGPRDAARALSALAATIEREGRPIGPPERARPRDGPRGRETRVRPR